MANVSSGHLPRPRQRGDSEDVVGIVLRAVALAAIALSIGVGASLLLEPRPAGYLAVPAAKP
jgi:hypothetical protein